MALVSLLALGLVSLGLPLWGLFAGTPLQVSRGLLVALLLFPLREESLVLLIFFSLGFFSLIDSLPVESGPHVSMPEWACFALLFIDGTGWFTAPVQVDPHTTLATLSGAVNFPPH